MWQSSWDSPCEQIFKTLVLKDEKGGHYVCCIPVDQELDLKKVARACKAKKVEMLPLKNCCRPQATSGAAVPPSA